MDPRETHDSISGGCRGPVTTLAAEKNIQVVHITGNGANVWWGAHCLDSWLGADAGRWDIITVSKSVLFPYVGNRLTDVPSAVPVRTSRFGAR